MLRVLRGRWIVVAALAALVLASVSSASSVLGPPLFVVGATDDHALADGGAEMYGRMTGYGLSANRMNVSYDPAQPSTIVQQAALERAIAQAVAHGVRVFLSITPAHPADVTGEVNGPQKFADYAAQVARAFPQVTDFIIGNEPNLIQFWSPTYNPDGSIAGGASYEATLAASYDALKAVNPGIDVIGMGLSPRGNPNRRTIPPVRFIKAVGDAYRASGRTRPLMDNVGLHPYPDTNTDAPEKGYPWPNLGVPNLDRGQQAFWDAFHGTGQPTFQEEAAQRPDSFVKWVLDESGWQTNTVNLPGYTGTENVPPIDESTQATYNAAMISRFACDPHIAALLFFNFIDESDRGHFQTGLIRTDGNAKPSADAVKSAIARGCTGPQASWTHSTTVDGARVDWKGRVGRVAFLYSEEDATYTLTATPKKRSNSKSITVKGTIRAHLGQGVKVPGIPTQTIAKQYKLTVTFSAAAAPERTSTFKHS